MEQSVIEINIKIATHISTLPIAVLVTARHNMYAVNNYLVKSSKQDPS